MAGRPARASSRESFVAASLDAARSMPSWPHSARLAWSSSELPLPKTLVLAECVECCAGVIHPVVAQADAHVPANWPCCECSGARWGLRARAAGSPVLGLFAAADVGLSHLAVPRPTQGVEKSAMEPCIAVVPQSAPAAILVTPVPTVSAAHCEHLQSC